jgi:lactate permease
MYVQELNPLGHRGLSTLVAALPVLVLFYLLVGRRWVASLAGAAGALVAILIAVGVYGMPVWAAGFAFLHGMAFGLLPIGWTVFAAMLLYNLTVETGEFAVIRRSVGALSGDARVQAVLIGFCFGAFLEGAAGAGSPVAVCGAMLVGLGVPPLRAAVLCLLANTSPVCFGGLGVPTLTLGSVTGIDPDTLSVMAGHQLPILSCLIPLYMVKTMCSWRETLAVWPALAVGGGSFALFQYAFATFHRWVPGVVVWPFTDIGGGLFSLLTLAAFLKFVWKPRDEWMFPVGRDEGRGMREEQSPGGSSSLIPPPSSFSSSLSPGRVLRAWSPFLLMAACLACAVPIRQMETARKRPLDLGGGLPSAVVLPVPHLHERVQRADRLARPGATADERTEKAVVNLAWATAPGTPVFVSAVLSAVFLRAGWRTCQRVLARTAHQMTVPIPTIALMLGLSYVTKYAGIDATLGVAFAETGVLYPFFAAILGWLGVFLTGTDAGSNALFGSLQKITAGQVHAAGVLPHLSSEQAEVLICTANSTGGVMGKMIDAQSICVATAGTDQRGREADIFRAVIWHSVALAGVVGLLTVLQAYLPPFTRMVPHP